MDGLYPIIRRKRRPLVSVGDAVVQAARKVVAKQQNEADEKSDVKNEEASTTERSRPTVDY